MHALAAVASRRAEAYALLARLVLEMPSPAFLRDIEATLAGAVLAADLPLSDEIAALSRAVRAALAAGDTMVLCAEHTRLFGGVSPSYGPPPPYESLLREGRLPGQSTAAVSALYAAAGIDPALPEAGPADHLAIELRFIALCCLREAQACAAGNAEAALAWVLREQAFIDEHLLAWVPAHCAAIAGAARDDYHRTIAQLVALACELDRVDLEDLAAELSGGLKSSGDRTSPALP